MFTIIVVTFDFLMIMRTEIIYLSLHAYVFVTIFISASIVIKPSAHGKQFCSV
jgi:hypothetical protein